MTTPEHDLPPTPADKRNRSAGLSLIGAGVYNVVVTAVCAVLLVTLFQVTGTNRALISALTQQRDQFTACKDKPATTRGCTTPVAAEPSVIVKQGSQGLPGLPGLPGSAGVQGLPGPQGPVGPQGPQGPPGAVGKAGLPGDSPACLLEPARCIGATGAQGPKGDTGPEGSQGPAGAEGKPGADGKNGTDGAPGLPGKDAPPAYSVVDTDCIGDDTASFWRHTYSNGTDQFTKDGAGPCRIGPQP